MHPIPPPRPVSKPAMPSIAPPVFLPPTQEPGPIYMPGSVYMPVLGAKWTADANFYDTTKLYGFPLPRLIKGTATNAGAEYIGSDVLQTRISQALPRGSESWSLRLLANGVSSTCVITRSPAENLFFESLQKSFRTAAPKWSKDPIEEASFKYYLKEHGQNPKSFQERLRAAELLAQQCTNQVNLLEIFGHSSWPESNETDKSPWDVKSKEAWKEDVKEPWKAQWQPNEWVEKPSSTASSSKWKDEKWHVVPPVVPPAVPPAEATASSQILASLSELAKSMASLGDSFKKQRTSSLQHVDVVDNLESEDDNGSQDGDHFQKPEQLKPAKKKRKRKNKILAPQEVTEQEQIPDSSASASSGHHRQTPLPFTATPEKDRAEQQRR